jgi:hypothetical protein
LALPVEAAALSVLAGMERLQFFQQFLQQEEAVVLLLLLVMEVMEDQAVVLEIASAP